MNTFADKVIKFNKDLKFNGIMPAGIRVMNPFRENPLIPEISGQFYKKFYNDNKERKFIIGINPGRNGAGVTGIPFTDTKRLSEICDIKIDSFKSHELSSVFVYEMIEKYGGVKKFYEDFYINSVSPLGFVKLNPKGNWVNMNYYDDKRLYDAVYNFMIKSLKEQISFGINNDVCFVLGKKNAEFLNEINSRENLFRKIVMLHHPRYIAQYKLKSKNKYISEYLKNLKISF
jgi:uracil-DNA glycosylase